MTFTGRYQVLIAWATEPFNPSPSWTDVTAWVRLDKALSLQRGRQDNISSITAGRTQLTADNSDGRFTVGLSTSPWAPDVKIGRRIQVNIPDQNGTLHTRFDGLITELPLQWEGGPGIENLTVIQAADILSWVSRQPQLLSWTQQEMLADNPIALWSLADASTVTQATDQAGQGAAPLQVVSQGDGSGQATPGGGVPLTEIQVSNVQAAQQTVQVTTFTTPGSVTWTAPLGTIISCDVICIAGGTAGTTGTGSSGGKGGEEAEEPDLAVTPGTTYSGTVGVGGVPSAGAGGNTTFTGDSVTVTAHASGSGSTNTDHHNGGSGGPGSTVGVFAGGGGGASGGQYQAGNNGGSGSNGAGAGGVAAAGGGAGGTGDAAGGGGGPGSQPGGGGGGGGSSIGSTAGGQGGAGQITITCTYIPPDTEQQNSTISSWLFTPSSTLGARVLAGALPQPVTAAAGFAFDVWADFAAFPAESVTTYTTPGAISPSWPCPPGITTADVICIAGGTAGTTGTGSSGGKGGEEAEEPALAVTPGVSYAGTVGAAGVPSAGAGGNTSFAGDSVTVLAHGSGSGSSNTDHHNGGSGGGGSTTGGNSGGGGGASGGQYQAGNNGGGASGSSAGAGAAAPAGGGGGGGGDSSGGGGTPGSQPGGGGGGGGSISGSSAGGGGGAGQITVTAQLAQSTLLTLTDPRGQTALAVWVTSAGHLQLASTSGYGTRAPTWTTVDAGQVPSLAFHTAVSVAATGVATLYVNDVSAGTVTLPAGASYTNVTAGGAHGAWLGGWNGSAGLLGVYPAPLTSTRTGVHYTAGTTAFIGTSTGNMIAKIAGYIGLPSFYYTAPSGTSDPSYGLTLVSYYDINGQQPLTAMQQYETAEGGVLSVTAAGQLVFADRASRYAAGAGGSAFTLAAGQYEPDTSYKSNDQYLTTEACFATTDIPGGYPVTNSGAEDDFGPYIQQAGSVGSPQVAPFADATGTANTYSTDDIADAGWWEVNVLGEPVSRVPALTVDLLTLPAAEFSVASFYGLDIGSCTELAGLPSQAPDSTGQPLSAYQVIEGINETLSLNAHTAQLYTSPLAQNAAWIPGDTLLGVLGTTDVIGRSQAPVALGPPYFPVATFGSTLNRTGAAGAQDMRTLAVSIQDKLTPPLLIAQQATAQTLATAAGQAVTFDTLAADTAGGMGALTTYTIQAGYSGWYWLAAVVQAATGSSSLGGLTAWFAVSLSGTASQWHARSLPYLSSAPYTAIGISGKAGPFSAGDTIQVIAAWSGSATSVPLGTSDGGSMFTLMWEGYT